MLGGMYPSPELITPKPTFNSEEFQKKRETQWVDEIDGDQTIVIS